MASNTLTAVHHAGYGCPMHGHVWQSSPGVCPDCGMALMPDGARFGLLRHMVAMPERMLARPMTLAIMGVIMAAVMAAVMMK